MRVIFLNRFFYPDHSATSQLLSDLAFFLSKRTLDVHVITSCQLYDDPEVKLPQAEMINGVDVHRIRTSRFGRSWLPGRAVDYVTFYCGTAWCLWRLAKRGDIVIVETDPPLISVIAALVAHARGAKTINWLQDIFPEVAIALGVSTMQGYLGKLLLKMRNYSLYKANRNVVIGERMLDYLHTYYKLGDNLVVIHNWADGEAIIPLAHEKNPLRQEWGLGDKFVIAYSGNMGRAHEFETLLGAAAQLSHRPDIVFLLVGDGYHRGWIEREIGRRNLSNIMLKPYQPREKLKQSLSVADVHLISLLPSMEGLIVPSKFYGAAAAGRAILMIGDQGGEIAQLIKDNECGSCVPVNMPAELAAKVVELAGDPAHCRRLGRNARTMFDVQFDRHIACTGWENLLKRVSANAKTKQEPVLKKSA